MLLYLQMLQLSASYRKDLASLPKELIDLLARSPLNASVPGPMRLRARAVTSPLMTVPFPGRFLPSRRQTTQCWTPLSAARSPRRSSS